MPDWCNRASRPIAIAVEAMYKYKYSQIPIVQNGRFIKLLTTNTIANWLGSCITDEIFSIMETSIEEVCAYNENEDNCFIISRHASLFYLIDRFREYERKGKRLEAVLITESGKDSEQLLGIVTIWDLPRAYEMIK